LKKAMLFRPPLALPILASWALAGGLLTTFFGEALAVKATPDTVYCSPSACEVCSEFEHTESGDRCVKCTITSTDKCVNKSGAEWTPGNPAYATVKDLVDVYNSPVKPRKVIGTMAAGNAARILDYHPDGWCKLDFKDFPDAHATEGWIAEDHLEGCP
jgi:hypothetical protein